MSRRCDLLSVGVMTGNKVSHSNRKTRRRFLPNLKTLSFRSDVLGVDLSFKVAASTARTINKHGGVDNFLVNYRYAKLSDLARGFRKRIKDKLVDLGKADELKIKRFVSKKPKAEVSPA